MKRLIILSFILLLLPNFINAQTVIVYSYDESGNRVTRTIHTTINQNVSQVVDDSCDATFQSDLEQMDYDNSLLLSDDNDIATLSVAVETSSVLVTITQYVCDLKKNLSYTQSTHLNASTI